MFEYLDPHDGQGADEVKRVAEEAGPLPDEDGYLDPPLHCGTFADLREGRMPTFDQEGPRQEPPTDFDVNHKPRRRNGKRVRRGGSA
jgi:hypothetical protein